VLNVVGVGGSGKSRLLAEMRDRASERGHPCALVDLQAPALRQVENALAAARAHLGACKIKFPRFDIGYAALWQRLHPHLRISREALPLVEHSDVLTDILDGASGVPVFGTAVRLTDAAARRVRRWQWIKSDATLGELDELSSGRLMEAVTFLFVRDLLAGVVPDSPPVLFIDAYEALVGGPGRSGRSAGADGWLRDLVGQLDRALVVVASREPLGWEAHDPDWAERIRVERVDALPMAARLELLASSGVGNQSERQAVATASAGLPFYLHLAVDALDSAQRPALSTAVSPEMILERFLLHVDEETVRCLELLSVARVLDQEIFEVLTEEHGLAGHQLAWERLTSYSFVTADPAGGAGAVALHQLMVAALRGRLSAAVVRGLHLRLRKLWDSRADDDVAARRRVALREAAHHGVYGGEVGGAELLTYVDRIAAAGGTQGIDGVRADIEGAPGLAPVARFLDVHRAVLLGDADQAAELTAEVDVQPDGEVAARTAVAAGHARRIQGRTEEALRIYLAVWERAGERSLRARLEAGLWAADLHMCQGRFAAAEDLADQLVASCPGADDEFRGDVARLRHLVRRFTFDLAGAADWLEQAERHYRAAGSVWGLANLQTNRAELLALLDPQAGVVTAAQAVKTHRELGALHELGKALTAQGVAQLALIGTGRDSADTLARAQLALREAAEVLRRAPYRSGLARAELFSGLVAARLGELDSAVAAVRAAVSELEHTEVYPTLIVAADLAVRRLGRADPDVAAAAVRARRRVQPLEVHPARDWLDRAADTVLTILMGPGLPVEESITAAAFQALDEAGTGISAGFYNVNVRLDGGSGPVLVRAPVPNADVMDLRIWSEAALLRSITDYVAAAPRVRLVRQDPQWQVHDFVTGEVVDTIAPRGKPVPPRLIPDVIALLDQLADMPCSALPALPPDWPQDADTVGFARGLSDVTAAVLVRHRERFGRLWLALGVPSQPLEAVLDGWRTLRPRAFGLVHADLHRKNMISTWGGAHVFIDWELALWGDPLYELATHLHKMAYLPSERSIVLDTRSADPRLAAGWELDLETYLRHERVKSAVVDSVRYAKLVADGCSPELASTLCVKLAAKLGSAYQVWERVGPPEPAEVSSILRSPELNPHGP